ncbi:MAG TPA: hypothetical protein VM290_11800 [Gaiellaceae bacterium]|jgi:DNA-binding response OmpR family regulator|nr:hypothetical protein [Gaiellaceae bacterium]
MPELPRVLVYEPDRDLAGLFAHALRRGGYAPVRHDEWDAGDAVAAVVMEPGGPDAATLLARLRAHAGVPIVCVSNHPREAELAPAESRAYLLKPFRVGDLVALLGGLTYDGAR